jgi:hypothetical protein
MRIVQHLRDHGFYKLQTQDRGVQRPRHVANIFSSVEDQPGTSSKKFANNISHSTIWRILKMQQLYPYYVQKFQCLELGDLP